VPNRKLFFDNLFNSSIKVEIEGIDKIFMGKILEGSKLGLFSGQRLSEVAFDQEFCPPPQLFDLSAYTDRYPYLIDQGMQVFSRNNLYTSPSMQVVSFIKDAV